MSKVFIAFALFLIVGCSHKKIYRCKSELFHWNLELKFENDSAFYIVNKEQGWYFFRISGKYQKENEIMKVLNSKFTNPIENCDETFKLLHSYTRCKSDLVIFDLPQSEYGIIKYSSRLIFVNGFAFRRYFPINPNNKKLSKIYLDAIQKGIFVLPPDSLK